MTSNEEGALEGVLPRGGVWKVEVEASDPKLDTETRVEVDPGKKGKADIEIRLPDTYVFGRVVDETGRPASGANVALSSPEGRVTMKTGATGEFDLYAVPEGKSHLKASFKSRAEGELTSDVLSIEALDSSPVGPLTLKLRKTKVLRGRVQSLRGPVVGAVLRFHPLRPALGVTDSTQSELDGSLFRERGQQGGGDGCHREPSRPLPSGF